MHMRVEFFKLDGGRLCGWTATPPNRRTFQGTTMASGRDLPHDLGQFVVEATLRLDQGFWGLLANGASFKSVPGRRTTRPGRALARVHHEALADVESIVNSHVDAWRGGAYTPVAPALDHMYARWRALAADDRLTLDWTVRRLAARRHSPMARRA
jgi:hypothetical protein